MLRDISLEEARALILKHVPKLDCETISLSSAYGRILSSSLFADENLPAASQSAVDGYALGEGGKEPGSQYRLTACFALGETASFALEASEAAGVMTGGVLPDGCVAVVPQEKARLQGNILTVLENIKTGNNIKQVGEDYQQGEVLLQSSTCLDPGSIGLLAAFGVCNVPVYRRPRIAILSLGANAVSCELKPEAGFIRDSNSPMLSALVQKDGGEVVNIQQAVNEDTESQIELFEAMLGEADLVITTGGSYKGEAAEALQIMQAASMNILYGDAAIQPGSHQVSAYRGKTLAMALSGNPAACAVGYQLFVSPALRAMQALNPEPTYVKAKCLDNFKKTGSRRFIRAHARFGNSGWEASILPGQKPSMIKSLLNCNALIDLPAGHPPLENGSEVSLLLLDTAYFVK